MNLLQKLKYWWGDAPTEQPEPVEPVFTPIEVLPVQGGIRKAKHLEWSPDSTRKGGRIVKAMPKELRRVKEAQELVEDDDAVSKLPSW